MAAKKDESIQKVAEHLLRHGPEKTHASARRVRLFLDGTSLADTTAGVLVWEKPWYPCYYIPRTALRLDASDAAFTREAGEEVQVSPTAKLRFWRLGAGTRDTGWRVVEFCGGGALDGLVRVAFDAIDEWFEEDVRIHVHPKDPFKRVDVLPSSRHIRVFTHDGATLLAETHFAMHLHETLLPTRFYMPITAVNRPRVQLRPSPTRTACPYKGVAAYYHVELTPSAAADSHQQQPTLLKDLVWYYDTPNIECAGIAGLICFYNEKVSIEIDGVRENAPKTHFA